MYVDLPVFPSLIGLAWPVMWSPRWNYNKQDALSGARTRTSYMSYPVYDAEVAFNVLRFAQGEWQQLQGFINAVQGGTGLWLYDNPNDDAAVAQDFGEGDGASTTFQLVRALGGFAEPVFFPNVIADVNVAGVPVSSADYNVTPTGQVVFDTPPANGAALTWDGTFYWGCRFDDDSFQFDNFMSQLLRMKSLKFSTEKIRVPATP